MKQSNLLILFFVGDFLLVINFSIVLKAVRASFFHLWKSASISSSVPRYFVVFHLSSLLCVTISSSVFDGLMSRFSSFDIFGIFSLTLFKYFSLLEAQPKSSAYWISMYRCSFSTSILYFFSLDARYRINRIALA